MAALHPGVDWVLVEGFKESNLLKVEVWRPDIGMHARYPDDAFIAAIATDAPIGCPRPPSARAGSECADAVADWLIDNGHRFDYDPQAYR
jgi:molybdopterin-guanine dinucleotide biosynthesis adapter protein